MDSKLIGLVLALAMVLLMVATSIVLSVVNTLYAAYAVHCAATWLLTDLINITYSQAFALVVIVGILTLRIHKSDMEDKDDEGLTEMQKLGKGYKQMAVGFFAKVLGISLFLATAYVFHKLV